MVSPATSTTFLPTISNKNLKREKRWLSSFFPCALEMLSGGLAALVVSESVDISSARCPSARLSSSLLDCEAHLSSCVAAFSSTGRLIIESAVSAVNRSFSNRPLLIS